MTSTTKPAATRLYIVILKGEGDTADSAAALIEASNPSQAARHFIEGRYAVRYAEQADIISATKAGIEVETASGAAE